MSYGIIPLKEIANVLIGTGTILSIFGLKISQSPIEETFVDGKPKKAALVEVIRPKLLKIGVFFLIIGSLIQIALTFTKGRG